MTIVEGLLNIRNVVVFVVDKLGKWVLWLSPVAALFYYLEEIFTMVNTALDDINGMVVEWTTLYSPNMTLLTGYFASANFVFPVTEAFAMLGAYAALRVIIVVIRWGKLLIPGAG